MHEGMPNSAWGPACASLNSTTFETSASSADLRRYLNVVCPCGILRPAFLSFTNWFPSSQRFDSMQIWPAIDLRGGKCVRLQQGDYGRETVFGDDPLEMAQRWVDAGAEYLHLVDLDGARDGHAANRQAVESIVSRLSIPCELGGGVRDENAIKFWLDVGVSQLVVGTQALKNPDWFRAMCDKYPHQLVLGLDARDGFAATDGWLETSRTRATEVALSFSQSPIAAIVYTDIAKDGMLAGPNVEGVAEMVQAVPLPIIASGGVTTTADVQRLASIGASGCIIGRTLYEGRLTLAEALAAAAGTTTGG